MEMTINSNWTYDIFFNGSLSEDYKWALSSNLLFFNLHIFYLIGLQSLYKNLTLKAPIREWWLVFSADLLGIINIPAEQAQHSAEFEILKEISLI